MIAGRRRETGKAEATTLQVRTSEERANAATHGLAVLLLLGAAPFVLAAARSPTAAATAGLFTAALLAVFLFSTCHHWVIGQRLKRAFLIFDHLSIYLLIAATYTPLVVLALPWGHATVPLSTVWLLAGAGMIVAALAFATGRGGHYERHCHFLHLAVAWLPLPIAGALLLHAMPAAALWLIAAGCLAYTVGVPIYLWRRFRWHHAGWHVAVMVGAGCHFAAVAVLVSGT